MEKKTSTYTLEELIGPLNDVEKKYAPKQVYVAGQLPIPVPSPRVAVIGSRKASLKGLDAASNIARVFAKHKVIVVSGLAEGIDSSAHKGAIEANGHTIAVLGTPHWIEFTLGKTYNFKKSSCESTWQFLNFQSDTQFSQRTSLLEIEQWHSSLMLQLLPF
jgi:hypothetical protein